jgi:cholesterol oxidase
MNLPLPRIFSLVTADGVELRLVRLCGGSRGPLILAAGYAMSTRVFTLDTVDTNLARYLCGMGFDVWLLSWRSSPDVAASTGRFTLDDVARLDWPAAVGFVREHTAAAQVDCVVHCIGSQTLLMSMALGQLDGQIRSAVCLQVGLYYDMPPIRRLMSRLRLPRILDMTGLRYLDASATVHNGGAYRVLDALLRLYPVSAKERCANHTCRRAAFMWGELLNHANINDATHDRMGLLLGNASIRPFVQMASSTLAGRIVSATGEDSYLAAPERLRMPITFIHGGDNATVGLGSTASTHDLLCAANGADLYRRHVVAGYGHLDCLIGDNAARDVFGLIGEHLVRIEERMRSHA